MRAAVVYEAGAAPVCAEFPEPEVTKGRAAVELVGAGVHQVVRSRVAGRHYSVAGAWPAVPGVDAVARTPDGRLVYTGFVDPPWGTRPSGWPFRRSSASSCPLAPTRWLSRLA